jgi:competence protein ComEA
MPFAGRVARATNRAPTRSHAFSMPDIILASTWRDKLEGLAGRRRQSALLLVVVLGAVVGGVALWSRGAPATVAPPALPQARPSSPDSVGHRRAGPNVLVHVAGAVRRPGLYEMASGGRVADAVRAAGGPTRRGDLDALNLAEPLVDGTKIEVPRRGEVAAPMPGITPAPGGTAPAALIPLNTADQAALESIPEVGPVTALAILEYRAEIGAFDSIDQLLEVTGIGPATLEAIRPYVTL